MEKIKYILITVLLFFAMVSIAKTPQLTLLDTAIETLDPDASSTITVSNVTLTGDSVGVIIQSNVDSLSLIGKWRYTTSDGYYNVSLSSATSFTSKSFTTDEKAIFTYGIPQIAGSYAAEYYFTITNWEAEFANRDS